MLSITHKQCYKVLNADINSNWEDLRRSYRTLIQKWHPDRFKKEDEKELATNKLKEINMAYTELSNHYRKYGSLPLPSTNNSNRTRTIVPQNKPKNKKPEIKTANKSNDASNPKKYGNRNTKNYFLVAVIMLFILAVALQTINTPVDNPEKFQKNISTPVVNHSINALKKIKEESQTDKEKYFTYRSSIGEVILIQGAPDRMQGDIWYYGESEIHFANGKVIKWIRTSNNPLNARAIPTN